VPFTDRDLDFAALFGRKAPVTLEIGFGNGDTLALLAERNPDRNYFGIEVHRPGVGRLLRNIEKHGLDNLRVGNHDAVEVLKQQIPDASLDAVLLYFPDPWPKKRHHKRRIVQPEFAELIATKLAPGGRWHLATDWENYAEHMLEVLNACPELENLSPTGDWVERPPERPETHFERRGKRLGHQVWDLMFRRRSPASRR